MTILSLTEAELHGLVDGQIEVQRRADILRRAAGSPADRDRIGSWQGQGELIRAAFQGLDKEPVPSSLDLRVPARLHALPSPRLTAEPLPEPMPVVVEPDRRRGRLVAPALMAMVAGAGLAATWFAGGFSVGAPRTAMRLSGEEMLARRALGVLGGAVTPAEGVAAPGAEPVVMPAASIPDLTPLGFTLAGADAQAGEPASLVFRYRNASGERLAVGVAWADGRPQRRASPQTGEPPVTPAVPVGDALVWRTGNRTYALAGTSRPERLRAVLGAVRALAEEE